MIGILVELVLSYLILKYFAGDNFAVLGLKLTKYRLLLLVLGVLWPVVFYSVFEFSVAALVHNPYHLKANYTPTAFIDALLYVFRAVVFEELIFRGAILYVLIKKLGYQKAVLISSIAFGIYHWFSWNAFGNPGQMAIIFFTTASGGYLFALAFAKSRTMYLPAALHFGANFSTMILFSKDKAIGTQLFVKSFAVDPVVPTVLISMSVLIVHYIGFQVFSYLVIRKLPSCAG
ncbi:MAG: CPBP family intramembrane glutamic endopeptidase [Bacteroidota bacterium]